MIARFLALLATSAALVTSAVAGAAPAQADAIGLCTATHGTIVAVDFSHWGGPIVRGCGVDSKTGYALLHDGGFTTAGDQHDGPAFICRLGNGAFRGGTQYPTPDQDACVVTPPASAYWSYWVAPRGQSTWSYSQYGAMRDVPSDGGVELWQFGATNVSGTEGRPAVSPDSLRAQNSSPAPTTGGGGGGGGGAPVQHHSTAAADPTSATHSRSSSSRTHRGGTPNPPPTSSTTSRSSAGSSTSAAHSSPTKKHSTTAAASSSSTRAPGSSGYSPATSASGNGSSAGAAPAIVDASPASRSTAAPTGGGSPAALVVGGGLVVVLAAGAGWTIMRRRRTDPDV